MEMFKGVTAFLMFIGYPRSGHSLIGSLLDAHPHMMVANEYHILKNIRHYQGNNLKHYIFNGIYENCKQHQGKRIQGGYNYTVPNQYQGDYKDYISIIGDKKGGSVTDHFIDKYKQWYDIIRNFQKEINHPIKCLHVVRNPFDNIATMAIRIWCKRNNLQYPLAPTLRKPASIKIDDTILDEMITSHFSHVETNEKLSALDIWDVYSLYTEDFLASPAQKLTDICHFLGVTVNDSYLDDCVSIVMKKPSKTSKLIDWPSKYTEQIKENINKHPILAKYKG